MGYGKKWKVSVSDLEDLIDNADPLDYCQIEVWSDTSSNVADCELWLKMAGGWSDGQPDDPPPVDPT